MKPLSKSELREALVRREPGDHKGVFGHAAVVAGSRPMSGAAILAARAALCSGAGLVTAPENATGCLRPEAVARLRAAHRETEYTVLAIGPGLSRSSDTAKFVLLALNALPLPAVVDADALNILAAQDPVGVRQLMRNRKHPCIFTPHPGEMARILRVDAKKVQAAREGCADQLAREWGGVSLLKGRGTLISNGARTVVNPTGGPGLAKGGTGDVLTGLIAGLWAQLLASERGRGDTAFLAAALGAWLHGRAGELAEAEKTGYAMTALDVIACLPAAFRELA